jgi:hypothetical protein
MCWYMCALFDMAKAMPYVSLSPYMNSYKWPLLNAFRNHVHSSISGAGVVEGGQKRNGDRNTAHDKSAMDRGTAARPLCNTKRVQDSLFQSIAGTKLACALC